MIRGKALMAGILFPLLLLVVGYALLAPRGAGDEGRVVYAEFQNVDQLVPGHDVRVHGTKVGSIADTTLTDRGTVRVKMTLVDGAPTVRADATASVRVADLLGDVFLVLEPGQDRRVLQEPIPTSRTFVATRVQDVLNVFDRPTRTALQGLIVELGRALDARGADVNGAVLGLSPLLREVTRVSSQLSSQRADLDRLVVSARALTGQIAPRSADIRRLIDGLDRTFAITSARSNDLQRGLRALPATLRQTRTTLGVLDRTAVAATPLARDLGAAAPQLTTAVTALAPFARQTRPALAQLRPTLRTAATTLAAGRRSLPRLTSTLRTARSVAPSLRNLSDLMTPLTEYLIKGVTGGLGSLAAEPGDQALDKSGTRNWYRAELVLGCEMFGVPTRPGCLTQVVEQAVARERGSRGRRSAGGAVRPQRPGTTRPATPSVPAITPPATPAPVKKAVDTVTGGLDQATEQTRELLDYLLGP